MKKHTISSPALEIVKNPRTRTFTPIIFNDCQLTKRPSSEKTNLIEKISSKRKRYSILNVPKLRVWEIAQEAIVQEEAIQKVEKTEENCEKLEEKTENYSKEKGVKLSLAKIKKIRRSYRPTFLHNQENLKAELEKFKDKEENSKPRALLNDHMKNIVKSDIEQIMESQGYFRSFGGGKNMKKSSEYLKTERATKNSGRNRKYSVGAGSINNQENEFGTPLLTGKKTAKNEGFSERMIFSSFNHLQRTPLPVPKIEKASENSKPTPSKSYSVALSQQQVKRIKTHKIYNLL